MLKRKRATFSEKTPFPMNSIFLIIVWVWPAAERCIAHETESLVRSRLWNLGQRPEIPISIGNPHKFAPNVRKQQIHIYMSSKRWSTKNKNSFGKGFRNVEKWKIIEHQSPSSLAWTLAPAFSRISTASLRPYPEQREIFWGDFSGMDTNEEDFWSVRLF